MQAKLSEIMRRNFFKASVSIYKKTPSFRAELLRKQKRSRGIPFEPPEKKRFGTIPRDSSTAPLRGSARNDG
jgi:hypothetical protein